MTPNTDRMNQIAKRHVDQMLREGKRGDLLALNVLSFYDFARRGENIVITVKKDAAKEAA